MRFDHCSAAAAAMCLVAAAACSTGPAGIPANDSSDAVLLEDFSPRQVFPASNWWNLDISAAPVAAESQTIIDFISGRSAQNPTAQRKLHPDFGPPPYGIPYIGVSGQTVLTPLTFVLYGGQS